MKRKIIIHNGNIAIGGQEKMLVEFLKVLDSNKYDVLLLIEENNGEDNAYLKDIPKWIKYEFLTTEEFMKNLKYRKENKTILNKLIYSHMLKKKKKIALEKIKEYLNFADIIIDYDMGLLRYLHKLPLTNKKVVGWSHAGSGALYKSKQKNINIEKYNYIVAINEEMKKGYEKNLANPKIEKIYNFMEFESVLEKSQKKIADSLFQNDYIVTVGSLTKNKNQELLIEAFSEIKKEKKIKEKLFIIGEGKEKFALEEKIKEFGMENEIFLLGQKENPYPYMKGAKLFVLTSNAESFSLVTAEAMILETMVISTPTNGTKEILGEDSKYGKLLKNSDSQELAEVILYYLENENERKKYESKGIERIKNFDKKIIKKDIEEFIDKL